MFNKKIIPLLLSLFLAAVTTQVNAQTTSVPSQRAFAFTQIVCPPNLPDEAPARILSSANVSVTVPAGRFRILESPPDSGDVLVCYQANAGVRLSGTDCREIERLAATAEENDILDQIVETCSINPPSPTMTPTSVSTPPTSMPTPVASGVTPPATGTAGLLD